MKIKKLIISLIMITYVTSSCANPSTLLWSESPIFVVVGQTEMTNILFYSSISDEKKIVYGLSKNNDLIKQTIYISNNKFIHNKTEILYTFDKSINAKQISLSDNSIVYFNNGKIIVINTQKDNFKTTIYNDEILKNSKILNVKIIENDINIFCKQNKNDYFIYKLKAKERIDFNFNLGTVINDFYFYKNNYYVSGYIKDPFLSDQYAYFTQTDKKGKMIYEKQIGSSEDKAIGFTTYSKYLLFDNNNGSYYQYFNDKDKIKFSGKLIDAKVFNIKNKHLCIAIVGNKLLLSNFNSQLYIRSKIAFNSIIFKNDTVKSTKIGFIQDKTHPFIYETKDKYKKGDAFQAVIKKIKNYNFLAISFSDDGKVLKYFPKKNSYDNENIIMPSKDTKFDKLNSDDEYLLLLYYKGKNEFIEEKEWNKTTIDNLKLYFSLKKNKINYYDSSYDSLEVSFINESIIPVLIKFNGQNN